MQRSKRNGVAVIVLAVMATISIGSSAHAGTMAMPSLFRAPSGSTFVPEPVPAGMVSKGKAVNAARQFALGSNKGRLPPGVYVRAYFGIYTDTLYTGRPVWIVRFWGPGLRIYGSGGPARPPGTPFCAPRVAHEELVVIGGRTGKYLEADVGLIPDGLPTIVTTPEPVPTPCAGPPAHAISPSSVGIGSNGNIFIGGSGAGFNGEVQKRSPAGKLLFSWPNSTGRRTGPQITHLALDRRGDVCVAEENDVIQKFDTSGHLLWTYPRHGPKRGSSAELWALAVSPDGRAYFPGRKRSKILRLSAAGRLLGQWKGRWDYLAADVHGMLYAANVSRGEVAALSSTGRRQRHWLIETSPGVGVILSISTGPDGSVYVLERRQGRTRSFGFEIARYSSNGRLTARVRIAQGESRRQLSDPRDLAVGPRGTIFIVDGGNPRLSTVSPSGRYLTEWQL